MRVLIVEDEKSLAKAVGTILQKNNYSVDLAYDGEEAMDYIYAVEYDAIVLDIMLPKKDGISVLRDMRKEGITTPVLMLTAKSEIDDKVEGLDSGANDYMTKPFDTKELLARLRVITRKTAVSQDNIIQAGNVTLNSSNFELRGPSGNFILANKEYQMMEMLMSHPKMLISADRFFEQIWGLDTDTDTNVVWVYISYLRKKLESIGADIRIKAKRNAGYFIEEDR
ncbi:MAG: response regulator transcription factor [Clostridia bacterium]|nr:response regulator transcription factor [Clostridia bacterium]